jgi:hypothetical protein
MKVFISSVVSGMEEYRDAAARAARTLKHEVLRSEDFGASPTTPQRVCLAGVREADVVLLLIGHRYGTPQASGLSPTHEEFRDAQERGPILVFVQKGVDREEPQEAFLSEVQSWSSGLYTASFTTSEDLRGDQLELRQQRRSLTLDQLGTVSIQLPAEEDVDQSHLPVLVEEFISEQVEAALNFAGWVLDHIDSPHRLQEVAPVLSLSDAGYFGWKTRAENRRSPNSVSMGIGTRDSVTVHLRPITRRREGLRKDAKRLAEDLTVLLRREKRG